MMADPCIYRGLSDEAFRIDAVTGRESQAEVWLCNWPTTLSAVPPWHQRLVGPGLAISPERDCATCPVRQP